MTQAQAMKILQSGHNVFLTGSAGSGKTFLLNQFIDYLRKEKVEVGITASTGIAATHLGGRTIHSWSGMGIEQAMGKKAIKRLVQKEDLKDRIKQTKILIIDEISMLDAGRLDLLDQICKAVREPFLPFGGLQVIMCGDFFQLPPIDREKPAQFAYESFIWQDSEIKVCYLHEQFRQEDLQFVHILNKIRANQMGEEELNLLNARLHQPAKCSLEPTKLFTHNADVDAINAKRLARILKKEKNYDMSENGTKKLVNFLKKNCLAPVRLKLKVGATVMFVKNNFEQGYVNGTMGQVVGFEDKWPIVKISKKQKVVAKPARWIIEEHGEVIASIRQVPLRLAWAITVHKSQGMSLDAAEMDLSKTFEPGMGYVALSRVKSLDGICLLGINALALQVSQHVVEKDKEFQAASDGIEIF